MKNFIRTFLISISTSLCIIAQLQFAIAQTASILPQAETQFLNNNGDPVTSGTVDFYIPGSTTRKTTWQDADRTIANANPVKLNGSGRAVIYGYGGYRQVLKDRNGNLIWDRVTNSYSIPNGQITTGDGNSVGTILQWSGLTTPNQYVFAYGQAISRVTFPEFFAAITLGQNVNCSLGSNVLSGVSDTSQVPIGATMEVPCISGTTTVSSKTSNSYTVSSNAISTTTVRAVAFPFGNGDGSTTFNVPDFRGRVLAGRDNMGGIAASRLTSTYFANASAIGATGGNESETLTRAQVPTGIFSGLTVADTRTWGTNAASGGGTDTVNLGEASTGTTARVAPVTVQSGSLTSSITDNAGGQAHTIVQPTITINYIVKVTPDQTGLSGVGVQSIQTMQGTIVCDTSFTCAPIGGTNTIGCTIATTSQLGCVFADGTTIAVNGSGRISAISSVASGVAIGTTTVSGGSSGQILYDNAGILGALSVTGSGNVVLATSPTLTTASLASPTITGTLTAPQGTWNSGGINSAIIGAVTPLAGKFTTLTATGTLTTNVTGSTQCLHVNTSGIVSGTGSDCGTGSASLTVGSTAISGGASGSLLYDNAGVLGEQTIATLMASPPAIGGTTPASGAFTVLSTTGRITARSDILMTNIVAPSTPSAGLTDLYVDSTNKVFSSKNDAGTVSNTVVPSIASANQFATGISAAGVVSYAQPAFSGISGTLGVSQGGTGAATFSANLPLIGNGTSAISTGTRSGNTTAFVTATGALTSGHCAQWDASGNAIDSGGSCGGGGSGTVSSGTASQLAYYASNGTTVSGLSFAANSVLQTNISGVPAWTTVLPSTVMGNISQVGTVTSGVWSGTPVSVAFGGTNATSFTANTPIFANGSGTTLVSGTRSGNTTAVVTTTGAVTTSHCAQWDASGNIVDSGTTCGGGGGVNAGTAGNLGYYATTSSTISGAPSGSTTTFNSKAIWSGDQYFGSGRPWCDVRSQGAVGDGSTDDSAAFAACVTVLHATAGGTIYIPPGNGGARYCLFTGLTTNSADTVNIIGASRLVDVSTCNHNGVATITLQGDSSRISNLTVFGFGGIASESVNSGNVPNAAAIKLQNCVGCIIEDVFTYGGNHGIHQACGASDLIFRHVVPTNAYGNSLVYQGCASAALGTWFERVQVDQTSGYVGCGNPNYVGLGIGTGTVAPWAASHAYTACNVVSNGGNIYQAGNSGTSAGAGGPTLAGYNIGIVDNGVTWYLLAPEAYAGILFDSGANQNFLHFMDIDGPFSHSIQFANTLAGTVPTLTTIQASNMGATLGDIVDVNIGNGLSIINSTVGNCFTANCVGLHVYGSFQSDLRITSNKIFGGSFGIDFDTLTRPNAVVADNVFGGWNQVAFVSGAASYFNLSNNICGSDPQYGGVNNQCYNVSTGDYYIITNNNTNGASVGSTPANGAGAAHSTVTGNL